MAEGDPNQVSTTPEVYVKAPNKPVGETVFIKWTCAQPPVNMAISAQRALKNTVSGEWNAWQSWTQADASQLSLTDATYRNIVKIRFTLTPTNGIATGTHGFTVYLDGLEDDTL
ncbi:hypothetical protein JXL21_05045 [Candidatus Bathyarchaeota archaeon]|nr:hypothetical protein [Candidatus Bathyarchaeota archaeon]